jgi:hypothetical protein
LPKFLDINCRNSQSETGKQTSGRAGGRPAGKTDSRWTAGWTDRQQVDSRLDRQIATTMGTGRIRGWIQADEQTAGWRTTITENRRSFLRLQNRAHMSGSACQIGPSESYQFQWGSRPMGQHEGQMAEQTREPDGKGTDRPMGQPEGTNGRADPRTRCQHDRQMQDHMPKRRRGGLTNMTPRGARTDRPKNQMSKRQTDARITCRQTDIAPLAWGRDGQPHPSLGTQRAMCLPRCHPAVEPPSRRRSPRS